MSIPTPSIGKGSLNQSQTAGFPAELSAAMTGAAVKIGTFTASPVIVIFDNQGTASVQIGIGPADDTAFPTPTITTWKTFTANEAMILDLRANHGMAPNFTISAGTTFWGTGASGTFKIAYLTAVP